MAGSVPGRCAGPSCPELTDLAVHAPGVNPKAGLAPLPSDVSPRISPVTPRATYRLQFTPDFGFDAAAGLASYLAKLGVSHLYASPYLKARPGSTPRIRHHRPQRLQPGTRGSAGLRPDVGGAEGGGAEADPRLRAQPHGSGRRRQPLLARRPRMGSRIPPMRAGSTSIGIPTRPTSTTNCSCRSSAASSAPSSRRASSA